MKQLSHIILLATLIGITGCEKFKTDATTGREFLLRQAPKVQHFGSGVTEFTGENGISIKVHEPFISLETGDTLSGAPEFSLVEYTNNREMLFEGIQTVSFGNLIISAGAFKLSGRIEGEPIRAELVEFFFPSEESNNYMRAFVGQVNEAGSFNWTVLENQEFPNLWWTDSATIGSGSSGYQGLFTLNEFWYENQSLYINCDYFLNQNIPLTNVSVRPSSESSFSSIQLSVSILFQTENAYMQGAFNSQSEMYQFYNVPIGYEVTCLAIGVDNNQELYFGMIDFEIEENGIYTLNIDPITEEELEDILEGL